MGLIFKAQSLDNGRSPPVSCLQASHRARQDHDHFTGPREWTEEGQTRDNIAGLPSQQAHRA